MLIVDSKLLSHDSQQINLKSNFDSKLDYLSEGSSKRSKSKNTILGNIWTNTNYNMFRTQGDLKD